MGSEKNLSVQTRFRAQPGDEPLAGQEIKRATEVSQGPPVGEGWGNGRGAGTPRHCPLCDLSLEAGACLIQRETKAGGSELTEGVCCSPYVLASFTLNKTPDSSLQQERSALADDFRSLHPSWWGRYGRLHRGGSMRQQLIPLKSHAKSKERQARTRFSCNLQRLTHRYQL